ncbi:helix-turn-helix transcriptional regulator [Rahnella victoriana]|uniref:helix-turn-helix transcriptional regulator n=1 Tax=Rahnella victoriana TaxID=1510570 RepID=UPI0013F14D4D|nr:LuxR C-terminal-related transcriptional regulator [Rahnella victoriana]
MLAALCGNKHITTVFFAQNMKAALLKKMLDAGVDIMISYQDSPQELVTALMSVMMSPSAGPYITPSVREHLQQECDDLTPKEWEVINLIQEGYSLSEIASKKCRAMSTVSTQKRNAMNKLHLKNESELLRFLHQNTFF